MKTIKRWDIKVAANLADVRLVCIVEHDEGFFIRFGNERDRNVFLVAFTRGIDDLLDALEIGRSIQISSEEINFVGYRLED